MVDFGRDSPEPEFGEIDADLRGRIAAIERFTDGFPIAIMLSAL